jgi:ferredoxin
MKKITIDKDLCIGCGTCTCLAPKTFKLDKEGKAELIESLGDNEKTIKEAIDSCPVCAIKSTN